MLEHLRMQRKADREKLAAVMKSTLEKAGATVEVSTNELLPRSLLVMVSVPGGARASVFLEGDGPQPGTFVVSWYMGRRVTRKYAPGFGQVNPYHGQKSTRVFYDPYTLVYGTEADVLGLVAGHYYAAAA